MNALLVGKPLMARAALEPKTNAIVTANTDFALDLYQRESDKPGNLFLSPYSVSTALAMTYAGARGQTATDMAKTLHFDLAPADVPTAFAGLVREIAGDHADKALKLDIANSLWCQQGFPFLDSFLQTAHEDFAAEAGQVDFAHQPEAARVKINSWVASKTQDKIKDLLQPGQLTPDTRLVLCNAIYFKGNWLAQFDPKATHSAPFFLDTQQRVQVPLMTKTLRVRSRQLDGFTAFALPYTSNALSMVILLPAAIDGLPGLEQKLKSANLHQWLTSLQNAPEAKSEVFLPKFKMNCRLDLTPTLSGMGMARALSANADFSGISQTPGLSISEVVHQAYVDVNEEGTEAAAATGTIMRLTAAVEHITVLRVDHPFLFLIRENRTGSILFMGRVMNPNASRG